MLKCDFLIAEHTFVLPLQRLFNGSGISSSHSCPLAAGFSDKNFYQKPNFRDAGKGKIFTEHITYADFNMCFYFNIVYDVCSVHGKNPQQCMKTYGTQL